MKFGPPPTKRDFLDALAARLGLTEPQADAHGGLGDDEPPTTKQKRITEDMQVPDVPSAPELDDLATLQSQLARTSR